MEIDTNNSSTKSILLGIGVVLIIFLGLQVVDKGYQLSQTFANKKPQNTMSVSAEGSVTAKPDLAIVQAGVFVQGQDADLVKNEASEKLNKITEFVKQSGIKSDDITTTVVSLYPQYDYSNGQSKISGYQANSSITIKVKEIDEGTEKVENILGGITKAGANQIHGVSYSFDDPDDLRQEARKLAIEKAKQKAQDLANSAGIRLGKIVSVSEASTPVYPGPVPYAAKGIGGGEIVSSDGGIAPTVESGTQDITAQMTVIFEVK